MRARRVPAAATIAAVVWLSACGGSSPAGPTSPPPPPRHTLTGQITDGATAAGIGGATVEVSSGVNTGRRTTTDDSGRYTLGDLDAGQVTIRVSAAGYAPRTQTISLAGPQTLDVSLVVALYITTGRVTDAVSSAGLAGISVALEEIGDNVTGADGAFTLVAGTDPLAPREAVVSGSGITERRTFVRVPGPDALVSVIPASFDLTSFDQMYRVPRLLRWTGAPPLVIEARTLQFTSTSDPAFDAAAEALTDGEIDVLRDDLSWALPQLSGDHFTQFARVTVQHSPVGGRVPFLLAGRITVARFAGLTAATGFWGYSRWLFQSDGTVIGGTIMLDRDVDRSGSQFRRSLRAHELGHALGLNHVTARTSVMNANARTEPTDFDRLAARIAFQRPPGNRSPDVDPDQASVNRLSGPPVWSVGIH